MNHLTKMFEEQELRIIDHLNDTWFVATDVCEILGLSNPTKAVSRLEEDERSNLKLGRQGNANVVNEFGLYNLVLGSRKPEAKKFKRWITHEVIPSIRKTGSYESSHPKSEIEILKLAVNSLEKVENRVSYLEDHMRVTGIQEQKIQRKGKAIVIESLGGMKSNAYKTISKKVFAAIWRDFKEHFEIPRYNELPRKQFEDGMKFLGMWQPSTSLRIEIENLNNQQTIQEVI